MSAEAESPPDHESDGHPDNLTMSTEREHHQTSGVAARLPGDRVAPGVSGENDIAPTWLDDIAEFDDTFWNWRPSLKAIYDAALMRMASPWGVFACCATAAISIVPPKITLPPLIGGRGSLNLFALILDGSGGGKSAAASVARELMGDRCASVHTCGVGSGEGLVEAYRIPPEKRGEPTEWRESVRFDVDEIDNLSAQGGRSGSTLWPTLRTAFFANRLGSTTLRSGGVHLGEHSYRLTLTVNAQPARCAGLLEDHGGGTPQRFMWFPAMDRRIRASLQSSDPLYPLDLPSSTAWPFERSITIPDEARAQILYARERRAIGMHTDDARFTGHALFCREKFAYVLAVLDGRTEMNDDDWMLSEFIADVSEITRGHAENAIAAEAAAHAARQGQLRAITNDAQTAAAYSRAEYRAERQVQRIAAALTTHGPMTEGQLKKRVFTGTERAYVAGSLQAGVMAGRVAICPDDPRKYQAVIG